jgi:hypothetical protein
MADKADKADKEVQSAIGSGNASQPEKSATRGISSVSYEKLKEELQQTELSLVNAAQLNEEQVKSTQDRLYKMIDYTGMRLDWYVDQCYRLLQIGLALIATGSAVVALFSKLEHLAGITQFLAWVFGGSLFLTGLFLVHCYNRYLTEDYPYRKVVDIHSWYFLYSFSRQLDPNLSQCGETAKRQVREAAGDIKDYFTKFLTHARNPRSLIREDIEQVTILLILQRYRHQQVTKMSKILYRGLLATGFILLLLILSLSFMSPPAQTTPATPTSSSPGNPSPGPAAQTQP